jgi:tetratricopeptide (TPR) repeat protein
MPTNEEMYDAADRLKDEGKLDEAIAKLNELLVQDNNYTLAHRALAVLYGRVKRHEDAIRHALVACQQEPNDAFSYTALSVTYVRAGRIQEAEDAKARAHALSGHRH